MGKGTQVTRPTVTFPASAVITVLPSLAGSGLLRSIMTRFGLSIRVAFVDRCIFSDNAGVFVRLVLLAFPVLGAFLAFVASSSFRGVRTRRAGRAGGRLTCWCLRSLGRRRGRVWAGHEWTGEAREEATGCSQQLMPRRRTPAAHANHARYAAWFPPLAGWAPSGGGSARARAGWGDLKPKAVCGKQTQT